MADTPPKPDPQDMATVRLSDATVDYIEQRMEKAVAEGIKAAMTDAAAEKFWVAGLQVLQRQAATKTGLLVGGAVMALARKAALFLVLGGIVYSIGGWTALATIFKALTAGDAR